MINLAKIPETLKRPLETDFRHFFFYKRIENKVHLKTFSFTDGEVVQIINSYNFDNYCSNHCNIN